MKTKNAFRYLMVAATVGMLFTACRKTKDTPADTDTSAASDNALAEGTYNDVHNISDEAASGSLTSYMGAYSSDEKEYLSTCATITHDSTGTGGSTVRNFHINFGTTDCMCMDGRNRRGTINISISAGHFYWDSTAVKTITFTNYYVNDNQVLGSKTVTNKGRNAAGNFVFDVSVNGTINKAGGGTITWTSTRTREWFQNGTPLTHSDDYYLITGSGSGTNASGNSFTATITTALRKDVGCHHFVSGQFQLTPSGKPTRYFDFGAGACDNQATVTINGNVYNITLG